MLLMGRLLRRISGIKKHVGWLLAELFIVFVGVYAAATLASYREQQRAEQRTQQLMALFHKQLSEEAEALLAFTEPLEEMLEVATELHESGQLPEKAPSLHVPSQLVVSIGLETWGAALQTGGIELLDTELIEAMEKLIEEKYGLLRYREKFDEHLAYAIEPRWAHAKKKLVEPNATLKPEQLEQRVCDYFKQPTRTHLSKYVS